MAQTSADSGRVLCLDLGDARIGVAISDPKRRVALPAGTIRSGAPADIQAVAAMVSESSVTLVVVGHPRSLSGEAGPRARHAERFAEVLGETLDVPVALHDERLSTVEAERSLRGAGVSGTRLRRVVDQTAATVILQSWLDARSAQP